MTEQLRDVLAAFNALSAAPIVRAGIPPATRCIPLQPGTVNLPLHTMFPTRNGYPTFIRDIRTGSADSAPHAVNPLLRCTRDLAATWIFHCEQAFIPERRRSHRFVPATPAGTHSRSGLRAWKLHPPDRAARAGVHRHRLRPVTGNAGESGPIDA